MADPEQVRKWAEALIVLHLDTSWSFGFDNAKKRAGLCNFSTRHLTVSRYLAARYADDDVYQILLHELAHAVAGPRAGHGVRWKKIAQGLGYDGKRTHDGDIADELAPWVGTCPAGHTHHRYRRPARPLACGLCARRFDAAHTIAWIRRDITPRMRRQAAASAPSTGTGT